MKALIYFPPLVGAILAAMGQVAFKFGATGKNYLSDYLNGWILFGLLCYGAGTALWIFSLSRANLTAVYPFTALTFILVYLVGVFALGEPTSPLQLFGVAIILIGLYIVTAN
ncbi:EamA family transporter [Cupriavidus sp. UYPR2.512]|uniref:EamA family transporter n=1 Tax=Cupriavidus sp. UYPR2.512 TaxID=1080187 RepID=UPI00038036E0|nr:EamA family transporter [Cupriavidus sp. UYPR2.512]UIF86865.1 EamA family transporter [Cupriavidus necator]